MLLRWWRLFRALGVPTMLFLAPALAVQDLPRLSYVLSMRGAVANLALEVSAVLALEACLATLLTATLSAMGALGRWDESADRRCAGVLTFISAVLFALALLYPLEGLVDTVLSAGAQAAIILGSIALAARLGWSDGWARLDRLNRSAQAVLALCPLLFLPLAAGDFGWRGFDSIAGAPRADPGAQNQPDAARRPNIVLLSFDALAAEDMSLYGYRLPTTPQFKRLARRSYNFVNFVSSSDFTTPAVASMLTGRYPLSDRVFQLYGHLPHRLRDENLARVLQRHGYTTAAIVTNPAAHPLTLRIADSFSLLPRPPTPWWVFPGTPLMQLENNLLFDAMNAFATSAVLKNFCWLSARCNRGSWVDPRAVLGAAQELIRGLPQPYFVWVHLYPPHSPYLSAVPFRGRYLPGDAFTTYTQYLWESPGAYYSPADQHRVDLLRLRYDERIAECDSALGEFLEWLASDDRGANTILAVTSDHGESFAGGWWSHQSPDLRYAETHIPLLISLPHQDRGYVETANADLADLAPTLLALAGIAPPPWMEGHALISHGAAIPSNVPSFSMYLAESDSFGAATRGAIAANSGPWHLVWYFPADAAVAFDIASDPEERHPLLASNPRYPAGVAAALIGEIHRRFDEGLSRAAAEQNPRVP
jgi:arylsulfatase A-like enzyme